MKSNGQRPLRELVRLARRRAVLHLEGGPFDAKHAVVELEGAEVPATITVRTSEARGRYRLADVLARRGDVARYRYVFAGEGA